MRGRGAAGKILFAGAMQVSVERKPERMRLSSVAVFRKSFHRVNAILANVKQS